MKGLTEKQFRAISFSILVFAALAAAPPADATSVAKLSPVVSTEWLAQNLSSPGMIILDIRKASDYEDGHIPGAVNLPFESLFVKKGELLDELPDEPVLVKLLGDTGISTGSAVVIIGKADNIAPEIGRSTRTAWTLTYAGVENVALLDGAFNKWVDEKRPVSTSPTKPTPIEFSPAWRKNILVNRDTVADSKDKASLVDVRPQGFYSGDKKHSSVERPGHITGAVCILSDGIFAPDKTFKPTEDLQSLAEKAVGSDKNKEIVTYCNTGIMSSLGWFVLEKLAGYSNVKMYDGSLQEWSKDPTAPMEE